MKKTLVFLFCYLNTALLWAQNVVSAEDQAQIKQVVTDEAQAFSNKQYDQWMSFYRQTPQVYFATVEKGKIIQKEGWDNLAAWANTFFHAEKSNTKTTFQRDKYNFRKVNPTYIWVTFDQIKSTDGKKESTKELRIVEMIKGEWKIVNRTGFVAGLQTASEKENTNQKPKNEAKEEKKSTSNKSTSGSKSSESSASSNEASHTNVNKKETTSKKTSSSETKSSTKENTPKSTKTETSAVQPENKPVEKPKKFFDN